MSEYQGHVACPYCMSSIHERATACPYCTRDVRGATKGDVRVADISARRGLGIILFIQLISLVLLLAMLANQT